MASDSHLLQSHSLAIDTVVNAGTRIEAYGLALSAGSPSAYYTVDDETAAIDVNMPDDTQIPIYNWLLLSRDFGEEGTHNITITTLEANFCLDYMLVTSSIAYVPQQPSSVSTSPSSNSTSSSVVNSSGRRPNIGAIAGGVVGGVVLAILAFGILLYRRRKNK